MESCRNEIPQKGGIAMKKYVSRLLAFFTAGALTSAFLPYPSSFVRADEKEAVNEPIELEEYITQTAGKHVTFTNTLERFYPGCDINYIFSLSSDGTLHKYLGNCSETVFMTTDSFDINDLNSELASKEINADIKEVRENEFAINMVSGKNGIIKSYNELLNTLEYSGKVSSIEMKYTFMEDKANSCSGYWFLFDSHVTTEYILDNYSLDLVPLQNEYLEDYPVGMRYDKYEPKDIAEDFDEIERLKQNEDFRFLTNITCLYPFAEKYNCYETIYDSSDEDNIDICFSDYDLCIEYGEEKTFEYKLIGADEAEFGFALSGNILNNTCSERKGSITIKADNSYYGTHFLTCCLKTGDESITKRIPVRITEATTFICPDCGRKVPLSERVSGPLRSICRDCYEEGHYIGTTVPSPSTYATSTTVLTSTITTAVPEVEMFYCPDCGRSVPFSERVSGPLRSICRDCYEEGHYIGTTVPPSINTEESETSLVVSTKTTAIVDDSESEITGDANGDYKISVADSVTILQFLGNKDKYPLTKQRKQNADVDGVEGITANDALTIQKWDSVGKH